MNMLVLIVITGIGATLVMDLGSVVRRWLFGTPLPDFALVGRWIAHMTTGRFHHDRIAASSPMRGERAIGWLAHYAVGISFAFLLAAAWGSDWFNRPSFGPALITGFVTVLAPFLVMQPAMGAGFAASRAPRPAPARLQSVLNHATFGLGLYMTALLINL